MSSCLLSIFSGNSRLHGLILALFLGLVLLGSIWHEVSSQCQVEGGKETTVSALPTTTELLPPMQTDTPALFNTEDVLFGRDNDIARDVAWGDVDGDGDLDLAVVGDSLINFT